jgi:hypothetical protein
MKSGALLHGFIIPNNKLIEIMICWIEVQELLWVDWDPNSNMFIG